MQSSWKVLENHFRYSPHAVLVSGSASKESFTVPHPGDVTASLTGQWSSHVHLKTERQLWIVDHLA